MFKRITRPARVLALAALVFSVAPPAMAQDDVLHGPNLGGLRLEFGADFTTAYYFRGILQEKHGFIGQPWAEIGLTLYEGEGVISDVELFFGTWNSVHSKKTGAVSGPSNWYESDFYAGLNFGLPANFSAGLTYTAYMSPNGAFDSVHEISVGLAFDDSELWGGFAGLQPYVLAAFEFDGQADGGPHRHEGIYLELGIEPSFVLVDSLSYPVTLSIPVTVGLSPDRRYFEHPAGGRDDAFGFFDIGAVVSVPLAFMGDQFGAWEAYAGVHYMVLGQSTKAINTGRHPGWEVIGTVGFSVKY